MCRTVLDHLPQDVWKNLDEPGMIDEPDLETYVFIKTKENVSILVGNDDDGDDEPMLQQHEAGSCLIVRYNLIRDLFMDDKVELLM